MAAKRKIDRVSLKRGPCYGTCPVYEVRFHRNGMAMWVGEHFTERLGRFTGEVDEGDFEHLAEIIERTGFFEWAARYEVPVTDNSEYEIEVARGGETKRVLQYATDEPPDFWTIATLIDGIAADIDWAPESEEDGSTEGTDPR